MEVEQLRKMIVDLHSKMREAVLKTQMKESKFDHPIKHIEDLDEDELITIYYWLEDIYKNQYKKYITIRSLLPEEIWARYIAFGKTDLREQVLLKEAENELKARWKKSWRKSKV